MPVPALAAIGTVLSANLWKIVSVVLAGLLIAATGSAVVANARLNRALEARSKAETKSATLDGHLAVCKSQILAYTEEIANQNAAIVYLKNEGDRRQEEAEKALAKVREEILRKAPRIARRVEIIEAPTPTGADCRAAVQVIRTELER